jgi:hypothetical protein
VLGVLVVNRVCGCMSQVSSEERPADMDRTVEEAASAVAKGECTAMMLSI